MGSPRRYQKHWIEYCCSIADISPRTAIRWAKDGLDISDNLAILEYKKARRHPQRGQGSARKEAEERDMGYSPEYYRLLADLAKR
jgi:hypothetical protein